ncbi:hypothetical protein NQ317_018203 [Molorchus minor]|uniref:Ecdysis triggering hormone n=1 Tax=Molorchus minor TaxID=1323400 RepID=A0ABQ9JEP5_9CUCU|nr:hypothetical protein NQ317_018203 [Molorchus minor]
MLCSFILVMVLLGGHFLVEAQGDEEAFFVKASKSVPRIGKRGSKNSAEFEKFFLKASKSVPRIGRRNENSYEAPYYESVENGISETQSKYPRWSEIAERYQHDPQSYSSQEVLARLEGQPTNDPTVYDWDNIRVKRSPIIRYKPSANQDNGQR